MFEFRVVDHSRDGGGKVRVVLAEDGETAAAGGEPFQDGFDEFAGGAVLLHDDRQTVLG